MHKRRPIIRLAFFVLIASCAPLPLSRAADEYNSTIAPLLRKYCAACHNATDREGGLSLDSYAQLLAGGKHGAVLNPRRGEQSRMIRMLTGQTKPVMPPADSDRPTEAEIAVMKAWIDGGAIGPDGGEPDPTLLVTPAIKPKSVPRSPINSVAIDPVGKHMAVARYRTVETQLLDGTAPQTLPDHRGNVNDVVFSQSGQLLVAASGEAGLVGELRIWNVADGKLVKTIQGHHDSLYAAAISPDDQLVATASYDRTVKIWNIESGAELKTLTGHNGAVYDVAFHPNGKMLATASDDRTVKLWDVATGKRLDTLGQSLKELYTLAFSPDGKRIAAGGVDNRIRVWRISDTGAEGTNPLLYSQFAHDAPILRLAYSSDGQTLVSSGEDGLIKVWNAADVSLRSTFERQPDWVTGLALSPDARHVVAGRLDGSLARYELATGNSDNVAAARSIGDSVALVRGDETVDPASKISEAEPNDAITNATALTIPIIAQGRIYNEQGIAAADVDLYAIEAKAGQAWIIETNAARSGSPVDTKLEVLNDAGQPVERLLLRAVRDSEITFRGVNSEQLECRVVNWEEMELNQYLYMGGEVCKLYRAPRGPDSGFNFYPNLGKRFSYFDTSARAHALESPCYIVEAFEPGSSFPENGLPIFPLYFENDDEATRANGKDSKLTFTAPSDGKYFVRVSDVRGLTGETFKYDLIVRPPQPDFKVTLHGANANVNAGSGKEFRVEAQRFDNFAGPIRVDITDLPPGFSATTPLVIQAGHIETWGVINAHPQAPPLPAPEATATAPAGDKPAGAEPPKPVEPTWSKTKVTATALIGDKEVSHDVNNLGAIKLSVKPKLQAYLELVDGPRGAEYGGESDWRFPRIQELTIVAGSSVTCRLRIERNDFKDRVSFEVNNLPHGIIVDDIGLNGVMITEGNTERTIFLNAAHWVPETSRLFHAVAKVEGDQVTLPILLHVRRAD